MGEVEKTDHFDRKNAETYDERWETLSAFNESLHLQLGFIFSELPEESTLLCVGAGTGAELIALAKRFPKWRFLAVDPSPEMLKVCVRKAKASGIESRCEFHVGRVSDILDTGRMFDAATSILISHFITDRAERLGFFRDIRKCLRPDGILVASDLSEAPRGQQAELMKVWLEMMSFTGADAKQVDGMLEAYDRHVSMLSEAAMENLLKEAGFEVSTVFSQTLLIRSWFARVGCKE